MLSEIRYTQKDTIDSMYMKFYSKLNLSKEEKNLNKFFYIPMAGDRGHRLTIKRREKMF